MRHYKGIADQAWEEASKLALTPATGFQDLPLQVQKYVEKERRLHRVRETKLLDRIDELERGCVEGQKAEWPEVGSLVTAPQLEVGSNWGSP